MGAKWFSKRKQTKGGCPQWVKGLHLSLGTTCRDARDHMGKDYEQANRRHKNAQDILGKKKFKSTKDRGKANSTGEAGF